MSKKLDGSTVVLMLTEQTVDAPGLLAIYVTPSCPAYRSPKTAVGVGQNGRDALTKFTVIARETNSPMFNQGAIEREGASALLRVLPG
jgi:hypothetical protein